jgi:hypothetical protein
MKLFLRKWYLSNLVALFGIAGDEKKMDLLAIYGAGIRGYKLQAVLLKVCACIRPASWLEKGKVGVRIRLV